MAVPQEHWSLPTLTGAPSSRAASLATPEALAFVAELHRRFEPERRRLLEARRQRQARYDAGYSPYLEVLSAQRTANDATVAWIQNRQARLTATVDLFKALGGGWKGA